MRTPVIVLVWVSIGRPFYVRSKWTRPRHKVLLQLNDAETWPCTHKKCSS